MKLLAVTPYYLPKMGGLENYAHYCLKELQQAHGWDVSVITSNHNDGSIIEQYDGIRVMRLPTLFRVSNTPVHFNWIDTIEKYIRDWKPDVVWGHMPVPIISDFAQIAAARTSVPFMCVYHNDLQANSIFMSIGMKVYTNLLLNRTLINSRVIINTSSRYQTVSKVLSPFAEKIEVVSPGVDKKRFDAINAKLFKELMSDNGLRLLFVSQLDKTHLHRGLPALLQALSQLIDYHRFILTIVGKGDYVEEYKRMVEKLSLQNYVNFAGFVSDEELPTYYKASDILIQPSTNSAEGFGMVLIEAGYHSVAVVASEIGGMPEILGDDGGLLIEPGSVNDLSKKLDRLMSDEGLRKKLGENLRKKVRSKYTWEHQVARLHSIITSKVLR